MLAEPPITDLSFKKKTPKTLKEATSQVMWVVENEAALKRASVVTPERMKKLGKWSPSRGIKTSEEGSDGRSFESQGIAPKSP